MTPPRHPSQDGSRTGLQTPGGYVVPVSQLVVRTSTSGGPGGQHANRTESKVEVRVHISDLYLKPAQEERLRSVLASRIQADDTIGVICADARSQHMNRQSAMRQLQHLIERSVRVPRHRVPTKPSRGAKLRKRASKQQRGEQKQSRGWRWDGSE